MIANITLSGAPPLAATSTGLVLLSILWTTITVIVCCGIPLTTGIAKGHVGLGIIFALITLPVAAFPTVVVARDIPVSGCVPGLLLGCLSSVLISFIPVPKKKSLLSQAEIEKEMQRARGY